MLTKLLKGEEAAPLLVNFARSVLESAALLVIVMLGDFLVSALDFGTWETLAPSAIMLAVSQLKGVADQIDPGKVRANDNAVRLTEGRAVPPVLPGESGQSWPLVVVIIGVTAFLVILAVQAGWIAG